MKVNNFIKKTNLKGKNVIHKLNEINPINKIKSRKVRIGIYIVLILIILSFIKNIFFAKNDESFNYEEVTAEIGNIDVEISGSGTIEPSSQYNITSLVQGEILEDYIEEGKLVHKDDILYSIDSEDIQNNIKRAELALKQSELSYQLSLEMSNITANSSGTIVSSNLKLGQMINQGMVVAEILDNSKLRLVLEYNYLDLKDMYIGEIANVIIENGFYNVQGYITNISTSQVVNSSGMGIGYVEIAIDNPGAVKDTDYAIANINGVISNNSNKFEYINKSTIYSTGSGYINDIKHITGDYVTKGNVIATIQSDSLSKQIEKSALALQDANLTLKNAKDQLDNYIIKSPITGKVILKNNKKGDILSTSSMTMSGLNGTTSSNNALAIVADMDIIKFTMKVDELEISKVKVGQSVKIKVEALDNREYTGYVDNINIVGNSVSGITNYDVKIIVNEPEGLFPGMNVDADIQVVSVSDVIKIPLSAVRRGNVVYIKDTNPQYQDIDTNVPKGYRKVQVEIGENNKEYIQITSGINNGDIVLVDKLKQTNILNFGMGMQQQDTKSLGN